MGIVNAVDICKYPQHFNRLLLIAMNKYVLFLIFIFSCIGCGETNEQDANTIEGNTDTSLFLKYLHHCRNFLIFARGKDYYLCYYIAL